MIPLQQDGCIVYVGQYLHTARFSYIRGRKKWSMNKDDIEKKRLSTRKKSDPEKIKLARKVLKKYANTNLSWVACCKEEGISISTLWAWVDKYNLQSEKAAAMQIAETSLVKYDKEQQLEVKEDGDGGFISIQGTHEYNRHFYAINRACVRYGMGEGQNIQELYESEGISRKVFYRYLTNFQELADIYETAKNNRQKLLQISFNEARLELAEGYVQALLKQVRPVETEKQTTINRKVVVGKGEDNEEILADEIVTKVQKEIKLPTAQILVLVAKTMGWIPNEAQILDGTEFIGEYTQVELVNQKATEEEQVQRLEEKREKRRIARLGESGTGM